MSEQDAEQQQGVFHGTRMRKEWSRKRSFPAMSPFPFDDAQNNK